MKKTLSLLLLLQLSLFTACNAEKSKVIDNAHQQARTQNFPQATTTSSRVSDNVVCHNCRATFKVASAMHKMKNGHDYIECPVCHHDYLKKAN